MIKSSTRMHRLEPWEEVLGTLEELNEDAEGLLARVGKIVVPLPIDLKQELSGCLGQRIAILRTDRSTRPFLWRILPDDNNKRVEIAPEEARESVRPNSANPGLSQLSPRRIYNKKEVIKSLN